MSGALPRLFPAPPPVRARWPPMGHTARRRRRRAGAPAHLQRGRGQNFFPVPGLTYPCTADVQSLSSMSLTKQVRGECLNFRFTHFLQQSEVRCWPFPVVDCDMRRRPWVSSDTDPNDFPHHCSPTFLRLKKSKSCSFLRLIRPGLPFVISKLNVRRPLVGVQSWVPYKPGCPSPWLHQANLRAHPNHTLHCNFVDPPSVYV